MLDHREKQILTLVALNQLLFTAGYSLTTGGFLYYFAGDLGADAFMMAVLFVIPETRKVKILSRCVFSGIFDVSRSNLSAKLVVYGKRQKTTHLWETFYGTAQSVPLNV